MPCEPGRIPSDQPDLLKLIATVLKLAHGEEVIWATDLNHWGPALLIAILVGHGQNVLHIPDRTHSNVASILRIRHPITGQFSGGSYANC